MNILIVEDEIPAQRMLKSLILETRPKWNILACLDSVESTVDWLSKNPHPDLMFLDIQLSDGLSFDIFNQVDTESMVVFTTAYDQYAIQAFKVNSIDYLLKPIKQSDLVLAIEKFEVYLTKYSGSLNSRVDFHEIVNAIQKAKPQYRSRFLLSVGDSFFTLLVEDIAFFYSANRVTFAVTFDSKQHVVDYTLEKLEEQLEPDRFFRANRQMILNMESIKRIEAWFNGKLVVTTKPVHNEKIVISREKARFFKRWMDR